VLFRAATSQLPMGGHHTVAVHDLLARMKETFDAISALPWGAHALVALAMAAGITLWVRGQSILKPLIVALAAILGGVLGLLVLPHTPWGDSSPVYYGLGIGVFAGIVVGMLLYRSAMAVAFGIVLGSLLPLGMAAYLDSARPGESGDAATDETRFLQPFTDIGRATADAFSDVSSASSASDDSPSQREGAGGRVQDAVYSLVTSQLTENLIPATFTAPLPSPSRFSGSPAQREDKDTSATEAPADDNEPSEASADLPGSERVRAFLETAWTEAKERWETRPPAQQTMIVGSAVVGAVAGIFIGLVMPGWGAAAVTAMFGAAVWLPCFVWLSGALSLPWLDALDRTPLQWLMVWGGASLVGMTVQWARGRRGSAAASGK
jgi:hypothetical protein